MVLEAVRALIVPDWPLWAKDVLLLMTGLLILTIGFSLMYKTDEDEQASTSKQTDAIKSAEKHREFDKFRKQYLAVYFVIMLADWM